MEETEVEGGTEGEGETRADTHLQSFHVMWLRNSLPPIQP